MILVTGTKRSGTSMWMQILEAAGIPWIGEKYLGSWEKSIQSANPNGFYESKLRQGVFYATNPHPKTGRFFRPEETEKHALKVFIPGLIRTDMAYITKVIATMRPWREYSASIRRLYALEDEYHQTLTGERKAQALASVARSRPTIPPEAEWWFEHYELVRDLSTRRYPVHLTTYRRMLTDPEPEVRRVLTWLGAGDVDKALAAIDPTLNTQRIDEDVPTELEPEVVALMDELHRLAYAGKGLTPELAAGLNEWQPVLMKRYGTPSRERMREDLDG